jgi:hypothetical protein
VGVLPISARNRGCSFCLSPLPVCERSRTTNNARSLSWWTPVSEVLYALYLTKDEALYVDGSDPSERERPEGEHLATLKNILLGADNADIWTLGVCVYFFPLCVCVCVCVCVPLVSRFDSRV